MSTTGFAVRRERKAAAGATLVTEGLSPWQLAWRRLRTDRLAIGSAVVIAIITVAALAAPVFAWVTHHGPDQQFTIAGLTAQGLPRPPSGRFWLGTDDLGRDVLVRVAYGARISLFAGVVADAKTRKLDPEESYFCRQGMLHPVPDPKYTVRAWRAVVTYLLRRPEFLYE